MLVVCLQIFMLDTLLPWELPLGYHFSSCAVIYEVASDV